MSEQITGSYEAKEIHELTNLAKLSGKEELIIDNGTITSKVTVDTLLGYIRDQINASVGGSSTSTVDGGGSTTIHFISPDDSDIPIESRKAGDFYIHALNEKDAQISSGLARLISVSPNMRLRLIED